MTLRGLRGNLMGVIVDVKLRAVGSYHSLGNGSGDLLDEATPGRSKIERKSFSTLQRLRTKPWDMCNTFDSEISRPPVPRKKFRTGRQTHERVLNRETFWDPSVSCAFLQRGENRANPLSRLGAGCRTKCARAANKHESDRENNGKPR